VDDELRALERRAPSDPLAALSLAAALRRQGELSRALGWLELAWSAGRDEAAEQVVDIFWDAPRDVQRAHVALLDRTAGAAFVGAWPLFRSTFPACARLGLREETRALRELVYRAGATDSLVTLAGDRYAANYLVARAIHEVSGRKGLNAVSHLTPAPPWETVVVTRLALSEAAAPPGVRVIVQGPLCALPADIVVPEGLDPFEMETEAAIALLDELLPEVLLEPAVVPRPIRNLMEASAAWTAHEIINIASLVGERRLVDRKPLLEALGGTVASFLRTGERFFD